MTTVLQNLPARQRLPHYVSSMTNQVETPKGPIVCRIDKFKQADPALMWFNIRRLDTKTLVGRVLKYSDNSIYAEVYDQTCNSKFHTESRKRFSKLDQAYAYINKQAFR